MEGISAIPGVLLVLNIGKALELEDVQDSFNYSNVVLVKWAPQLYLLEKASLFVTHSGMNRYFMAIDIYVCVVSILPIHSSKYTTHYPPPLKK